MDYMKRILGVWIVAGMGSQMAGIMGKCINSMI